MTWNLDPTHTEVGFGVKHLMVSTVKGRFTDVEANIELNEEQPEASRVLARVHTASVDTNNPDRDAHLRSPDFFDSDRFPVMTFESRDIVREKEDRYRVTGDLTIRDVTRPVELQARVTGPVQDPWGNRRIGVELNGELNREEFGLTWNVALEAGGFTVGRNVKLNIETELMAAPVAVA